MCWCSRLGARLPVGFPGWPRTALPGAHGTSLTVTLGFLCAQAHVRLDALTYVII
jgi:hypothetical protein